MLDHGYRQKNKTIKWRGSVKTTEMKTNEYKTANDGGIYWLPT